MLCTTVVQFTWPVFNGTVAQYSYHDAPAPVYALIGMAGAGYLGPWQPTQPAWSAFREQLWGWNRIHVANSTYLRLDYFGYTNATALFSMELTRSAPPHRLLRG